MALNEHVDTSAGANNTASNITTDDNHNSSGINIHTQSHTSRITTTEQDNQVEYRDIQEIYVHPEYGNGIGDLKNFTNNFALLHFNEISTITPVALDGNDSGYSTSSATSHQYNGTTYCDYVSLTLTSLTTYQIYL